MQNEQIPKLMIQKMQAVSFAHQDPMMHTDHISLETEISYVRPLWGSYQTRKLKNTSPIASDSDSNILLKY